MDDNKLTLVGEDGNETVCEIILTHEHQGKKYVIFEFMDSKEISAAQYVPDTKDESEGTFLDIETDEEWEMLDEVLEKFFDELEAEENE
ncbi:MAG: DUF1292 domain-containing protein [Acholeplasmataceae bacterium]|nr:DUF1292 domain-containing protein [Acholeplasmataceae bacterium]